MTHKIKEGVGIQGYPERSVTKMVANFFASMPEEGIIIHGTTLLHAKERETKGIYFPGNMYWYIPKPEGNKLESSGFLRTFEQDLRSKIHDSARIASSKEFGAGFSKVGSDYNRRFTELEAKYPFGYIPAKEFFRGPEGQSILPELIVAKAPKSLHQESLAKGIGGVIRAVRADDHPIPPENFLASVRLNSTEYGSSFDPDTLLVSKMVEVLVDTWKTETGVKKVPLVKRLMRVLKRKIYYMTSDLTGHQNPLIRN